MFLWVKRGRKEEEEERRIIVAFLFVDERAPLGARGRAQVHTHLHVVMGWSQSQLEDCLPRTMSVQIITWNIIYFDSLCLPMCVYMYDDPAGPQGLFCLVFSCIYFDIVDRWGNTRSIP